MHLYIHYFSSLYQKKSRVDSSPSFLLILVLTLSYALSITSFSLFFCSLTKTTTNLVPNSRFLNPLLCSIISIGPIYPKFLGFFAEKMGNCVGTTKKSAAEIAPSELIKPPPVIKLYGHPDSFATSHIRLALLYKPVTLQFVPSDAQENPTVIYKSDVVTGSVEEILRYLDAKFPDPPVTVTNSAPSSIWGWCGESTPAVVWVVLLQHRSMNWHLERMMKWAEDMAARGGHAKGDPSMGSPRMEVKKFAKSYSQLQQVMLEHAQMEERVLFQILESADRGLCKSANEEHGRDLPIMNGIKEEIKIIGVMNAGSPDYQEAFDRLLSRLKKLKDNCKEHFEEEERELLPLMEATELNKLQQQKVLQQSLDVMRETHSHLFRFFMEGLNPQDAMQYFGLIKKYCDNVRVSLMLHMMVD